LHSKGQEIVQIVNASHENLQDISSDESDKVYAFFSKYPPPMLSGDNKVKGEIEEFIHKIHFLETVNSNYIAAIRDRDNEKIDKNLETYERILKELTDNFNIKID
jgi:hypothetical protein